jgi:uncharacterized membrane protein YczE
MPVKIDNQLPLRVTIYIFSLALLAFGVAFAINSNLGLSPVISLPYVLGYVLHVPLSTSIIIVFSIYVLLQIMILRKDLKLYLLIPLLFAIVFGYFVDFFQWVLGDFILPTYLGQLVMVVFSAFCIGSGIAMYMSVHLIPLPMEGLVGAITEALKGKVKFFVVKLTVDCINVVLAMILSMIFLGKLVGIREGTVITALLLGPIVGLVQKLVTPIIDKAFFDKTTPVNV